MCSISAGTGKLQLPDSVALALPPLSLGVRAPLVLEDGQADAQAKHSESSENDLAVDAGDVADGRR